MPIEPREIPETIPEEKLGSLSGCLVDRDAEQRGLERRVRRHALAISVLLQSAVLTLLVLVPLFGKTERIAIKDFVPMPPYGHPSHHPRSNPRPGPTPPTKRGIGYPLAGPTSRPTPPSTGEDGRNDPPELGSNGNEQGDGPACDWCVNTGDKKSGPRPPQTETQPHQVPRVVHITHLESGMLIHRVEPVYPPLARQIHKEGRVELRAIIGTDGTIQSLQIVTGDPLFEISAREAVQQWRFRPTILNRQPVEIDTYITVIYTMQH
jgi:protein TonB